jgi:hypothetical protein
MADGRIFVGRQALDAGLADGIATVEDVVESMATNPEKFASRARAVFALGGIPDVSAGAADTAPTDEPVLPVASETTPKGTAMTPQELAAQFAAENAEACALIRAEGAAAERARIQSVRDQAMPGHEALIETLAFDGKTSGPEAAVQVLAAEKARMGTQAAARQADAPAPLVQAPGEGDEDDSSVGANIGKGGMITADIDVVALDAAAKAYQSNHPGASYLDAIKAVQKGA